MEAKLQAYLDRIGWGGSVRPDLDTLIGLHRAHLLTIPYENLDIHRGKRLTLDVDDHYRKIVIERRGGWCYEMNGLLAWALRQIGFEVTLLASTVQGAPGRRAVEGNHLILLVELDRPYLADVGFGNGFLEPLPLAEGTYQQDFLTYRLRYERGRWWFDNHLWGGAGFAFTLDPHRLEDFATPSHELQTSLDSGFVRTIVCHRHTPKGIITLRETILRTVSDDIGVDYPVSDAADYRRILETQFDLHLPDAEVLWDKIWAKHLVWLNSQSE